MATQNNRYRHCSALFLGNLLGVTASQCCPLVVGANGANDLDPCPGGLVSTGRVVNPTGYRRLMIYG